MPYAQERYLVQRLERVEQTFLSAHITQFETSVSCVSVPQNALRLARRKTNGTDYRITIRPADAKPCDKRSTFQESRALWRNPLYCLHSGRTTFWGQTGMSAPPSHPVSQWLDLSLCWRGDGLFTKKAACRVRQGQSTRESRTPLAELT